MNKFKQIGKTRIRLNGKTYKGYMLGDLPPTFAYISKEEINARVKKASEILRNELA